MSENNLTLPVSIGRHQLISAESASGKKGSVVSDGRSAEWAFYIEWSAGTSAGAVQIETAHDINYTGTWAPLGSPVSWSAASSQDILQITGVVGAIRARISTGITGGTVSVDMVSGHASTARS